MPPFLFGHFAPGGGTTPPEYHPGMLEVKLRTDPGVGAAGGPLGMAGPFGFTREMAARTTGLGALLAFERAGLIRRVTPIPESATPGVGAGETPLLASFAAAANPAAADAHTAGVAIVELHDDADTARLEGELRTDPTVESVSRVPVRYLVGGKPKKPAAGATPAAAAPPASATWNLTKIRWAQARAKAGFKDATAIKVAVLDTGIDRGHPDLAAVVAGYEFAHPTNAAASSDRDVIGHGTHVSGTIAAGINNNVGVNGICTCQLYMFKIFDDIPDWHPDGYFAYFVEPVMYQRALSRCLTLKVDVINLSIGGPGAPSANEGRLFARLIAAGTTVVAAMGNENSSTLSYPAAIPGVVAVGATKIDDKRASFSNYGPHIAVCAPGAGIWSTLPTYAGNQGYYPLPGAPPRPDLSRPLARDTDYASWDGTSMASPHVAGAVALYLAKHGATTPANVKKALMAAAVKVPEMGGQAFTPFHGAGRLDLVNLLK